MIAFAIIILTGVALLVGCQSQAAEEVPPTPAFQTGVHLQGIFALPDWLLSLEPFNTEMKYLIYLPEGYGQDPAEEWPLIFFLHGSGDDDYDSAYVMSSGLPEVLLAGDQPENFGFIVLSPQAFPNAAWWDRATPDVLIALLDEVLDTYQVDRDRIYLTGLSMGGYGTWYLASAFPDRFAAAVSVSGSGYRTPRVPGPDVLCRLENVPVWGIHGDQDQISSPRASRMALNSLQQQCGGEVRSTFYPDAGHFGAYYRAYRDPELYDWLLEHERSALEQSD